MWLLENIMQIENDIKLDFDDVLIRPKRSTLRSRKDVDLQRIYKFKYSTMGYIGVPIIAANMDGIGTPEVAQVLSQYQMATVLTKFKTLEYQDYGDKVIPSIGAGMDDIDFLAKHQGYLPVVCIDVANGYGEYFIDFIRQVRKVKPNVAIIAGNVVTREMTEALILAGADIVKVGLGSGSVCTTRLKTGVGYPQLSSVMECADAAHGLNAHIISDGGCQTPGDVAKAFAAGADFVMLGGMLAGHDETGSTFHGMSSEEAQILHFGEKRGYRASEGKEVQVESRGPLKHTIEDILGGLRSTCTYVGAPSLKQLSKCTTFIRVSRTHNQMFG